MKRYKRILAALLTLTMAIGLCACGQNETEEQTIVTDSAYIEETLNLANNEAQEWM